MRWVLHLNLVIDRFTPKTASKGAWISVFRPNVQSIQTFVFSKRLMRLQRWRILILQRLPDDQKIKLFKIRDGGRPPFWKIVKCDILATVWPILVKFGTAMHIRPPNLTVDQKIGIFPAPIYFVALLFGNGLQYHNSDFKRFNRWMMVAFGPET